MRRTLRLFPLFCVFIFLLPTLSFARSSLVLPTLAAARLVGAALPSAATADGTSPTCPCSLWPTGTPATLTVSDASAVELGVRFTSDVDGYITGIRFYKGPQNTGTHVGNLWSSAGRQLATAVFTNETASGWQEVSFSPAVAITANTVYVASYHTNVGYYSASSNYFATSSDDAPLHALANGDGGGNGVYAYGGSSGFPTQTFNATNYWVDVVFVPYEAPGAPPQVVAVSPAVSATNVPVSTGVTATFSKAIAPATLNSDTVQLLDAANNPISATVTYLGSSEKLSLQPAAPLAYLSTYDVLIKGGSNGIKDLSGLTMASDYSWTFTTAPVPPTQGPGGPILVITSTTNPFSTYLLEILRNEGLNEFAPADIANVSAATLSTYDVVVIGEMPLSDAQVTMLSDWVTAGGKLIAMRPDKKLATLVGLSDLGATVADAYLSVSPSGPGAGIVGESMQFHSSADKYALNGATAVATLYSDATTSTSSPAVAVHNIGSAGGQAAAFTYDLARSVVYTRQGNPAFAGQKRDDETGPIRAADLFMPDYLDQSKIAIPQADEQQRLLTNLILSMNLNRKPLPRFWYFPATFKAVIVMTGDDHGSLYNGSATQQRFDSFLNASPAGCSVADWQCVRSTAYVLPQPLASNPLSDAQVAAYTAQGFEVSVHVDSVPSCDDWTASSLATFYSDQLSFFAAQFPSNLPPTTHRIHCVSWSDYDTQPQVEFAHGIRLDTGYYYWPASWVNNVPGLFTGSGMPMRFSDHNGNLIDVYQAATQMTDESGQTYPFNVDVLLDRALGSSGYYGAFVASMHNDLGSYPGPGADEIVASAQARGVPIISSKQLLTWLDGRNNSSFGALQWDGVVLSFTVSVASGARGLTALLPMQSSSDALNSLMLNGTPVNYQVQTIKGIDYAVFTATPGNYQATYSVPKQGQTIAFAPLSAKTYGDPPITVTAIASSGLPVSFTVGATDSCTIAGSTVTLSSAGNCTVTAHQSGDGTYSPAPNVAQSFAIAEAPASVALGNLAQTYDGFPKPVDVTTNPPGLTVGVTYNGSTTVPSAPGDYQVVATITNPNYVGSATDTLVISAAASLPQLVVSPAALTFRAFLGQPAPTAQVLNIRNVGTGTMSWTAAASDSWIVVTPDAGGPDPASVGVSVNLATLSIGTYTGNVTITAPGALNSPQQVTITLDYTSAFLLDDFATGAHGWAISSMGHATGWTAQSGTYAYSGAGKSQACNGSAGWTDYRFEASVQLSTARNWPGGLRGRVNPTTGAGYLLWLYPGLTPQTLILYRVGGWDVDAGGLQELGRAAVALDTNQHTAALEFVGSAIQVYWDGASVMQAADGTYSNGFVCLDADTQPITYDNVLVQPLTNSSPPPATLTPTPASLTFTAMSGGASPLPQSVALASTGAALTWSASTNASWLRATPANAWTPSTLTVSADITGLATGRHTAEVSLSAPGASAPVVAIPVTFDVTVPAPMLAISPTNLDFTSVLRLAAPAGKDVAITNPGGGALSWNATADAPWIVLSAASGNAPATLAVSVNPAGLTVGTYAGTVTVAASGALNSPQTIAVSLEVHSPILDENFDAGVSGWLISSLGHADGWTAQNGAYAYNGAGASQSCTGSAAWTDYSFQTVVQLGVASGYPGGIRGRVNSGTGAGYGVWLYPSAGLIRLYKINEWMIDNGYSTLDQAPLSFDTLPHTIRMDFQGSTIAVYWDGAKILQASDSNHAAGFVCLDPSEVPITYDDVLVWGASTAAAVSATPAEASITVAPGATGTQTLNIGATNGPTAYSVSSDSPWLTASPTATMTGASLTVSVDAGSHATGSYSGNLTIAAPGATNSPLNIPITMSVAGPVAQELTVTTTENTPVPVVLSASSPNGLSLTYSILSSPVHGTLSGTAPNLTYTPTTSYVGADAFIYKANDGTSDSNTATVSITVNSGNHAPVADNQSISTNQDTAINISLNATDADGDPLTYAVVSQPGHGTLGGTATNLTYTPTSGYYGNDSFTFKANDGAADSNIAAVSITVVHVNHPPVANSQTVSTNQDTAVNVTLSATDADSDPLTYAVVSQPGHGALGGTAPNLTYTPTSGYCGNDSFTFKANDGTADSNTATVSVTVVPGTSTTLTSSLNPSRLGQPVTLTARVTSAAGTPTGTVTFREGASSLGTATLTSGIASFSTSALAVGSHSITATYNGASGFVTSTSATLSQVIQASTSTTLTSSIAQPTYGQPVTLTATVSSAGGGVPTGTLTFQTGGTVLGSGPLNSSGQVVLTTASLPVGSTAIVAAYSGDIYHAASSGSYTQKVNKASTTTVVASAPNPSIAGWPVIFTAMISPPGAGVPSGTVTFKLGSTKLGVATVDGTGKATLTISTLPIGSSTIKANYSGNGNFLASTGSIVQTVNRATATTTTITSSLNPSNLGDVVTFTALIKGADGGIPAGSVTFSAGGSSLAVVTLDASGTAVYATSTLPAGTTTITATYSGGGVYGTSQGTVQQKVAGLPTTTTLTSTPNPSTSKSQVTFTAVVTSTTGAVPTGTVTFKRGTTTMGTVTLSAGTAVFITKLSGGSYTVTATYNGDATLAPSTSQPLTQTVR